MSTLRPPHFSWATPYIILKNIDATLDFYVNAFDFKIKEKIPGDDGITTHAELFYKDQIVMFGKEGAYGSPVKSPLSSGIESPINLYVYCDNVDDFYKKAIVAGATSMGTPEDTFWGDRMCRLKCPEGYAWAFATYSGECKQAP